MANRVVMGNIGGGTQGIKVSRPGVNVLTAGDDDLMLNSDIDQIQIVTSGRLTGVSSNTNYDVTIPNLGFSPFVIFSCPRYDVQLSFPNATTVRLRVGSPATIFGANDPPNVLTYLVLNRPIE